MNIFVSPDLYVSTYQFSFYQSNFHIPNSRFYSAPDNTEGFPLCQSGSMSSMRGFDEQIPFCRSQVVSDWRNLHMKYIKSCLNHGIPCASAVLYPTNVLILLCYLNLHLLIPFVLWLELLDMTYRSDLCKDHFNTYTVPCRKVLADHHTSSKSSDQTIVCCVFFLCQPVLLLTIFFLLHPKSRSYGVILFMSQGHRGFIEM